VRSAATGRSRTTTRSGASNPWYDRQRPEPFAALRAAKAPVDPDGALNPGALIDP
jgi:FAD/FMN-containing dehydrogenase